MSTDLDKTTEPRNESRKRVSTRTVLIVGTIVSILLAGVVSFYASAHPDGLEHVAESLGFADSAKDHQAADSPLADYTVSGVADSRVSGGLAGLAGLVAVAAIMAGLIWLLRRSSRKND